MARPPGERGDDLLPGLSAGFEPVLEEVRGTKGKAVGYGFVKG